MNWPSVPIESVSVPTSVRDPRRGPASSFRYIDISSVDRHTKSIATAPEIPSADAPSRARKAVLSGDILVSTVRPNLNTVALVPPALDDQIASTGFCVLRPDPKVILGKYLFYFSTTPEFVDALTSKVRGAHYPAVSDADVKKVPVPLPPLSEQRRIVEILAQADALRKKRAEADAKAARILPALFYEMFGELKQNPQALPMIRVGEAGKVQLGRQRAPKYQTGKFTRSYVRVANVFEDRIDVSDLLSMDFDERDFPQYRLQHGDILLNEGQSTELVGRPAMWRDEVPECCFQNTLIRFQPDRRRVLPDYALSYFLVCFRGGAFATLSSKTSSVARLGASRFAAMPFPLPSLRLQKEFAARAAGIRAIETGQDGSRQHIESLAATFLHHAFSGDLTAAWRDSRSRL